MTVSSSEVPDPKYVRYGWANFPTANLFNQTGCPRLRLLRRRTFQNRKAESRRSAQTRPGFAA